MSVIKSLVLSSSMLGVFGSVVQAADLAPTTVAPSSPSGFVVTLGLGPSVLTSFPGARSVTVLPTGHIGYRRAGEAEPFFSPDDGFDVDLINYGPFKAGPVARYTERRGLSNGNGAFFGLHNIAGTVELGGFLEYYLWKDHIRVRGELRQGVNGHRGLVGNVEIDGIQRFGAFTVAVGPRLALGNDRYERAYFSVTPIEAALNGRVYPYQASGGVTSLGGFGSIRYDLSPSWSITAFGGYDRLVNSAAQSPIPNRIGSLNQFNAGALVAYSFNFKGFGILGY